MINLLKVYDVGEKIRLGHEHDGGYIVPKVAIEKSCSLFSYGISNEISFDETYIELTNNMVYAYDHTIDFVDNKFKENFILHKEGLSSSKTDCTNNFIEHFNSKNIKGKCLLKIDVEHSEYEYFNKTNLLDLKDKVTCIVIEFHSLFNLQYRNSFFEIIKNLNEHFYVCHVHGNNHDSIFQYVEDGIRYFLPNCIEITFVSKSIVENVTIDKNIYPCDLDRPNNMNKEDYDLSFLRRLHYKINTYKDLKNHKFDNNTIPKIIFRTSKHKLEHLADTIKNLYIDELIENDGYTLFYFDDEDCEKFIEDYKNLDLIIAFDKLNAGAYKADLFRYLVLYVYGGIYMDFSMRSLVKLDDIIKSYETILVKDLDASLGGIYNAFMCSKKGNPLFIETIQLCIENIKNEVYFDNVWELTGPLALKKVLLKINNENDVNIGEYKNSTMIYRLFDKGLEGNQHLILDVDGTNNMNSRNLVQTRISNHYKVLYQNGQIPYPQLYEQKKLFKNVIYTYKHLKILDIKPNKNVIPKYIFRTGSCNVKNLPKEIFDLYTKTIENNQEYTLFYFDDIDRELFIKENYNENYYNAYKKLIPKAYQADFFRYLVLYKFGGIYMDFSMEELIKLDDIIKTYKNVYVRDRLDMPIIYNAFIATISESKILKNCINKCVNNIENNNYGYHSLCVTSPIILGEVFSEMDNVFVNGNIQVGHIDDELFIYSFENGDGEYFKNPENNQFVVKNKIDKHYELLYKKHMNFCRYDKLWENKYVFKDELYFELEEKYKNEINIDVSLYILIHIYFRIMNGISFEESYVRAYEINKLYSNYLGRYVDEESFIYYYFNMEMSISDIEHKIINCEEYKELLLAMYY